MSRTTSNHTLTAAELFRENLTRLLADRGITLYQLSRECGINSKNVYGLANGSRIPRMDTLDRLADYFSVPVAEFFSVPKSSEKLDLRQSTKNFSEK